MKQTGSIRLSIDSCLEDVRLLGLAVRGLFRFNAVDDGMADSIELAIVEASNNAVIHAYGREQGHRVEVEIDITAAEVTIRVIDTGRLMGCWPPPDLEYDPKEVRALPEGGYGLFLIRQLMDTMTYESRKGRNVLEMRKKAR